MKAGRTGRCFHCGNCSPMRRRTVAGGTDSWPRCMSTTAALHTGLTRAILFTARGPEMQNHPAVFKLFWKNVAKVSNGMTSTRS